MFFYFPLFRAEHRQGGREKARGLSESAIRRASFRVLRPWRRRAGSSGTRAFSFASFSVTRQKMKKPFQKAPRIGTTFPGPAPVVKGLDQY
jgi:hypothetical protein